MSDDQIHVGDYGSDLLFSIYDAGETADLSDATTKTLKIIRSDDSIYGPVALSFFTDGTDGKLKYTVPAGTYTVPGTYQFQVTIVTPNQKNLTSVDTRYVWQNI